VLFAEPDLALAVAGDVFICDWRDRGTVPRLSRLREHLLPFANTLGRKVPQLVIIEQPKKNLTLLDSEERALTEQIASEMKSRSLCTCYVVLGSGFWAAAMRSLLATLMLMQRADFPNKVVGDLGDGCAWLAQIVSAAGTTITGGDLHALAEQVRAAALVPV
jgi:hypothetical protein